MCACLPASLLPDGYIKGRMGSLQETQAEYSNQRQTLRPRHLQFPHHGNGKGENDDIRNDIATCVDVPQWKIGDTNCIDILIPESGYGPTRNDGDGSDRNTPYRYHSDYKNHELLVSHSHQWVVLQKKTEFDEAETGVVENNRQVESLAQKLVTAHLLGLGFLLIQAPHLQRDTVRSCAASMSRYAAPNQTPSSQP